jgi:hypothetical protein
VRRQAEATGPLAGRVIAGLGVSAAESHLSPVQAIDQIRALRKDRTGVQAMFGKKPTVPVPACVRVPDNKPGGVGVNKVIGKLRAVTYVYQHPIVVWLGLTAVLAVPFLAGVAVGRMKK